MRGARRLGYWAGAPHEGRNRLDRRVLATRVFACAGERRFLMSKKKKWRDVTNAPKWLIEGGGGVGSGVEG